MTSKAYWEMRSVQDMVDRMGTAEQTAELMNKALAQSCDYIGKEVRAVFRGMESFGISEREARRILNAAGNKTALQTLRDAANRLPDEKQRAAMLSAIDSAGAYRFRIDRLEQLVKTIDSECRRLYQVQSKAVTSALETVAEDSYYRSIFNLQQQTGLGFSFAEFSRRDADKILRHNWYGQNYSQRIWNDLDKLSGQLRQELMISALTGRSHEKTMRVFRERFGVNAYCARRIVRTESAYVANAAQRSAYTEAGIDRYRFVATLDSKTSEECAELDGKIFAVSEAKAGTNYPPMHPFCRSTTVAEFGEDEYKALERRARGADGEVVRVPADMTYEEWKKTLDKSDGSGIMELGSKFLSKSDPLYYNADKIKPIKGYDDIVFHGDPYHLIAYGNSGEEWLYNAKEAAEMIKHCQVFREKPIRLIACQIGAEQDGIAQQIADELGVVVLAPTETVFVDIDGDMFISNNRELAELWNMSSPEERKHIHQTGTWIPFEPKKR